MDRNKVAEALPEGLYEQVIDQKMAARLAQVETQFKDIKPLDPAEAADILTSYVSRLLQSGLTQIREIAGHRE